MKFVVGLGCLMAFGMTSVINAQTERWTILEKQWKEQNSICLNGLDEWEGPLTPRMRTACNKRNLLIKQIRGLNRCYGQKLPDGSYRMEFHDCEPGSMTYSWPSAK